MNKFRSLKITLSFISLALFSEIASAKMVLNVNDLNSRWSGRVEGETLLPTGRSRAIEAAGAGLPSFLVWTLPKPLDMNKARLSTWIKFNQMSEWRGLELRLSEYADFRSFKAIPIRRYTDPEFNWLQPERWQKVSFSLGEGRLEGGEVHLDQIQYVGWYVEGASAGGFLVEFADLEIGRSAGPGGLVSLTFDDGHREHLAAAQVMDRFGLRGTAYVMPREIESSEGFLSQEDLKKLSKQYGWGVSAHHGIPFTQFTVPSLVAELEYTIDYLRGAGAGVASRHVAFPLGKTNEKMVMPLVRDYFLSARIAGGGAETLPPADWHRLRVINMSPAMTAELFAQRLRLAQEQGEWLILMFHKLVEGVASSELEYSTSEFKKVVEVIARSQVEVLPVHEAWEKYGRD